MKECKTTKERIENILKELKIRYYYWDIEDDDDVNYIIQFNMNGKLRLIKTIDGILYFNESNSFINFIIPNIYALRDCDELGRFYEILNEVNSKMLYGNFVITEDKNQIIYRNSINCGGNYVNLDKNLLEEQIESFTYGLENLLFLIKKEINADERQ